MATEIYEDTYVQNLFDRMGSTYDAMNLISSFGFSEIWRWQCVSAARIKLGSRVCDMMSGSGECSRFIVNRGGSVISIDFSRVMTARQHLRLKRFGTNVEILCENSINASVASESIDSVICAFGLKTLDEVATLRFAQEIARILKPGGSLSIIEISTAKGWLLGPLFRFYINRLIPWIGKLLLGDIECYRMLGIYTQAFGSCDRVINAFRSAGLDVRLQKHFFGCATSIVGRKLQV